MWNGTAEILKQNPTSSIPAANSIIGVTCMPSAAIQVPMRSSRVGVAKMGSGVSGLTLANSVVNDQPLPRPEDADDMVDFLLSGIGA